MPAKHISIDEFLEQRKKNKKSIVLDVRHAEHFEKGHIPGAINLNKARVADEIESVIPDKKAQIYCHCGGGESGAKAADTLTELGYKNAVVIDGGWRAYKAKQGEE